VGVIFKMKGIILAGGTGSRLAPLTKKDNKHLLPVYDKRMIEYPIKTLVDAGIREIILITGGQGPGDFLELLKNGRDHGIEKLYYAYQEGSGGICDALMLAEPFVDQGEACVVILGDNYFEEGVNVQVSEWGGGNYCCGCLLKKTDTPWYFGIAEVDESKVISIEEKPSDPKSDLAILGCYYFNYELWSILPTIVPSPRGELEITSVLSVYMDKGELSYSLYGGYWSDMGTFQSWSLVSQRVAKG